MKFKTIHTENISDHYGNIRIQNITILVVTVNYKDGIGSFITKVEEKLRKIDGFKGIVKMVLEVDHYPEIVYCRCIDIK
jgi:hypothetical protein